MIEVAGVYRYPLTGARAESLEIATVAPAGIEGDRVLVLYDGNNELPAKPRVSQLRARPLATVAAVMAPEAVELYIANYGNFYARDAQASDDVMVHEFGDDTPCHDMGDDHARRFQRLLGKNGVRLARKSDEWLAGGIIDPTERHNRPVHIVSQATVREVQSRLPAASFGAERFRPNILLDGDLEAFEENEWIGEQLVIDGVVYVVSKLTGRCPVPGYDQHTGQNRADVPKLYQDLPKNDKNKPVFGVYAYPVLERGDSAQIGVGMEVAA